MKTIDDIVAAVEKLNSEQFVKLRRKLDRLERKLWKSELKRTSKELKAAKITDEDIDRMVVRRRKVVFDTMFWSPIAPSKTAIGHALSIERDEEGCVSLFLPTFSTSWPTPWSKTWAERDVTRICHNKKSCE